MPCHPAHPRHPHMPWCAPVPCTCHMLWHGCVVVRNHAHLHAICWSRMPFAGHAGMPAHGMPCTMWCAYGMASTHAPSMPVPARLNVFDDACCVAMGAPQHSWHTVTCELQRPVHAGARTHAKLAHSSPSPMWASCLALMHARKPACPSARKPLLATYGRGASSAMDMLRDLRG